MSPTPSLPHPAPAPRRRRRLARLLALLALLAAAGLSAAGCASGSATLEQETSKLGARVTELEAANRQLQLRLDAYEASLTLIEDQVGALEFAGRRASRTDDLAVVRIEPPAAEEPDPYAGLYEREEEARAVDEDVVDIVVSDEKLERYFGGDASASSPPSAVAAQPTLRPRPSTGAGTGTRTPQPTVVHGDRLAVVPMKKDGSGVVAAAASPEGGDPIDLYKAGLKHYRQEQFAPAIELFEKFLAAKPPADYVDNALYWLGECHYGLAQYADAATYFHRIVQEFPEANKVPDALLKVGLTYLRLDKTDSAREVMYYLIEAYPETEAARVARERLDQMNAS